MRQISPYSNSSVAPPQAQGSEGQARRAFLSGMEWLKRHRGWVIFIVLAAAYYPMFGRGSDTAPFYADAGRCILRGEPLLACLPAFPYQPVLAVFLVPLSFLPVVLERVVWYVICVGSLVITVRLAEAIAERLYPGVTRGQNLFWLRAIVLVTCAKHIIDVLTYASHDPLALAIMTFAIWALFIGRETIGGAWLAVAAAIRASPLIFLPYLVLKRRFAACLAFVIVFLAVSFLPDMIGALRGTHVGYLTDWVRQVVSPAMMPGTSTKLVFWEIWNGQNLYNQSLRGLLNRFAPGPVFGFSPTKLLIMVDGAFALVLAVLLITSPRRKEYVAIDGAVLLIATLALSPMTSRYHYIFVLPPVIFATAATIADLRMRTLGTWVLAASFLLRAGTSNDIAGKTITDFAYTYGFMPMGAIVLYIAFAAMTWVWRPPGIPERESKSESSGTQPKLSGWRTSPG
jgi:glycosyl transferase family 87